MTTEQRLAEMRDHVTKAEKTVEVLCNGGRWTMSIPARLNDDPDIIISRALADAKTLIKEFAEREEEIARLRKVMERQAASLDDYAHETREGLTHDVLKGAAKSLRAALARVGPPAHPHSTNSPALEETKTSSVIAVSVSVDENNQ